MTDDSVKKSKRLSKVLRHDPECVGITLDAAGWTDVTGLLTAMKMTREELNEIVQTNNKKRFEFDVTSKLIRASQGHSVEVDLGYEVATPPDVLWHGTYRDAKPHIYRDGILKMSRHHVHLSDNEETAWNVARRRRQPIVLKIDSGEMIKSGGCIFYRSTNGVWLTDVVSPKFIIG